MANASTDRPEGRQPITLLNHAVNVVRVVNALISLFPPFSFPLNSVRQIRVVSFSNNRADQDRDRDDFSFS